MNARHTAVPALVVLFASLAVADEPQSIDQVKKIVLRSVEDTSENRICMAHLEERLDAAGFVLVGSDAPADAELEVTLTIGGGHRNRGIFSSTELDINYLVKMFALPSRKQLLMFTGHQDNSIESGCNWMAKKTVGKIEDAKAQSSNKATTPKTSQ